MTNEMHGLCQKCISLCAETISHSKDNECLLCKEQEPDVIFENQAICMKCYFRETYSPKKSELRTSLKVSTGFYRPILKNQMLSKGFLSSTGKMIKKIEKLFSKYEPKSNDLLNELTKKSLCSSPLTWEKITMKCDRISGLLYIFISKQQILGAFHYESYKIGEKSFIEDPESGFFISERSKMDLQFYKATTDTVVYSNKSKMLSIGNPPCLEINFETDEAKVRAPELLSNNIEWLYQFAYKL